MNQDLNNASQRAIACANPRNYFYDANLNRVAIANVQQATDNAFYQRAGCWIDSRLVNQDVARKESARVIKFGSPEFVELAWSLARQGRQTSISLDGDILLEVDGESILIKHDPPQQAAQIAEQ